MPYSTIYRESPSSYIPDAHWPTGRDLNNLQEWRSKYLSMRREFEPT